MTDTPARDSTPATFSQNDLPCPNTQRWDTKRKAQVVEAVRSGRLSLESACSIYTMSVDEFLTWQSLFDRYGKKGLMATRIKQYRRTFSRSR
ncbi:MAG: DUF1153 domain-containing protein [Magnetovibrio sp.]|nr:DUF1153 domain-containing protein [Magnetovibrio sp.]